MVFISHTLTISSMYTQTRKGTRDVFKKKQFCFYRTVQVSASTTDTIPFPLETHTVPFPLEGRLVVTFNLTNKRRKYLVSGWGSQVVIRRHKGRDDRRRVELGSEVVTGNNDTVITRLCPSIDQNRKILVKQKGEKYRVPP